MTRWATSNSTGGTPTPFNGTIIRTDIESCRLVQTKADPSHCLYLFDGDMEQVAEVFEQHHAESHGHGWEGLAESLVNSRMPAAADKLRFGSEAGTFVVSSSELKALTDLGVLLHSAFHNRELLSQYILAAHPRFLDR
ncbi:Imm51 family immunity protein [Streptomyces erythrochromogenes]|uniref:Imm51 family immunity protein n=1 Tax=Streptomyces erythrochromogenes TaxID=285574 RepID=UPI0037FDA9F1